DGSTAINGYFLAPIPQIGKLEHAIGLHLYGIVPVKIGNGAVTGPLFDYGCTRQRYPILIGDRSTNRQKDHFDHRYRWGLGLYVDRNGCVDPSKTEVGNVGHQRHYGTRRDIVIGNVVGVPQAVHLPVIDKAEFGLALDLFEYRDHSGSPQG